MGFTGMKFHPTYRPAQLHVTPFTPDPRDANPQDDHAAAECLVPGCLALMRWVAFEPHKVGPRSRLSNEKKPWLFRIYRGLYYPAMRGL